MNVRSLYIKILLLSFAILIASSLALLVISRAISYEHFATNGRSTKHFATQLEAARDAYLGGGRSGLAAYIQGVEFAYAGQRYVLAGHGKDLLTGLDTSAMQSRAKSVSQLFDLAHPLVIEADTADGSFSFMRLVEPPDKLLFVGYGLLFLGGLTALCWLLTSQFAKPLHTLSQTVQRFGGGDLSVRFHYNRRDEIGSVAQAFDNMADRIENLVAAERRLLEDVSHELRSPLARLSVAAELGLTSRDREMSAMRVKKEVDRLMALVDNLLRVTRAEADPEGRTLEPVPVDLLLSELVDDCAIEAEAKGCRVVVSNPQPVMLRADHELLRRAMENVLRNAIRHAPAGSVVEVAMHGDAGNISISVRDYGPGVPSEHLASIFDPFFRVDTARDQMSGGVGLGLAIAKRAINVHRGHIRAENAEPGLRVCMDLPVDQTA